MNKIKVVGVVGAGTMGNGIAHVFARGGFQVLAGPAVEVEDVAAFVVLESTVRYPMFDLGLFRKPTFTGGAIAATSKP